MISASKINHRSLRNIFTAIFCNVVSCCFGQVWAPIGATWFYLIEHPNGGIYDNTQYFVQKDTMFNGYLCRKIVKHNDLACYERPSVDFIYSRSDTVYFWDTTFQQFQILYNFNVPVNGAWKIRHKDSWYMADDTVYVSVKAKGMVNVSGQSFDYLDVEYDFLNHVNQSRIIKFLGDTSFFFFFNSGGYFRCDGWFTRGLTCYFDDSIGLVSTRPTSTCSTILPVPDVVSDYEVEVQVLKNTLTVTSNYPQQGRYRLISYLGREIVAGVLHPVREQKILLPEIASGLYVLDLKAGDTVVRKRIFIR